MAEGADVRTRTRTRAPDDIRVLQIEQPLHLLHCALLPLCWHALVHVFAFEDVAGLEVVEERGRLTPRLLPHLARAAASTRTQF